MSESYSKKKSDIFKIYKNTKFTKKFIRITFKHFHIYEKKKHFLTFLLKATTIL